jgi:hypothetical protein
MDRPTLEIVAGFHSGVAHKLENRDYRIGSSSYADIVLQDPGVEPEHAILRIERLSARIEATGGDVIVGGELLERGHGSRLNYPLELIIGQASIRLSSRARGGVMRSTAGFIARRPLVAGIGVIAAVVLAAYLSGHTRDALMHSPVQHAATAAEKVDAKEAAQQLSQHLASVGLRGLKVAALEDRVVVSGVLPESATPAWVAVQKWFDHAYKGRLPLTASVAIGEGKGLASKMRVRAIWSGERPYILTDDGVRRYENSPLEDGWVIKEIRDKDVMLSKDGQTIKLNYRAN